MKIYSNGEMLDKDSAGEVFEPGFLFGWGVFEVLRAYKRNVPFLDLHTERLEKGVSLLGIEQPDLDWEKIIGDLLSENRVEDAYIRITVYKKRNGPGLMIYADKFGYYGPESYSKGFSSIVSPYLRGESVIFSKVKTISYLQNRMSWLKAQEKGKDEALVLNSEGLLAGGSRSNIFLVKDNRVITPALDSGAFEGITRRIVIQILKGLGLDVMEGKINKDQIFCSEEAFLSSSLMEVMPLVACEDKFIGKGRPGKITLEVLKKYREMLNA